MTSATYVSPASDVAARPARPSTPMLWGLDARALHEAYWRAHGVQCVRRAVWCDLDTPAELYLLLDFDQLVLFDPLLLRERLTWRKTAVLRVKVVDEQEQPYRERVVADAEGRVQRIERRYRPPMHHRARLAVTTSRRIARMWMESRSTREGWDRARRSVAWRRVDRLRLAGISCVTGDTNQEHALLEGLVERWSTPDRAIMGIEQREEGVWRAAGDVAKHTTVCIGPLWLGHGQPVEPNGCLIGPGWLPDVAADPWAPPAQLRSIERIDRAGLGSPHRSRGRSAVHGLLKRTMDLVLSASALMALAPAMALIALLVKIEDGGPVLFGHRRQGRGGRPFTCWKFRTMHVDAERIARELERYNVSDGPQVYIPDDPRVTRIGRFLRRSNLDELPQLLNVLIGQMSLVGPRPSPDDENQFCPAWRDARLSVRPGITGLWQLMRTREPGADFQEWIRYDIEYVERANVWLDLEILLRTVLILTIGRSTLRR